MNVIKINNVFDLNSILHVDIYLSSIKDKEFELQKNMWVIMFNPSSQYKITLSDLQLFFTRLIYNRKKQIKNMNIHQVTLYVWYDDQLEQLCFNICSLAKKDLPFGCKINFVHSLDLILKQFLYGSYYGGTFPTNEIVVFDEQDCTDEKDFILNVYVISLL